MPAVRPGTSSRVLVHARRRRSLLWGPVAVVCVLVFAAVGTASAAKGHSPRVIRTRTTIPFRTALLDGLFYGPDRATALQMAHDAGASYIRLGVSWRGVAPAVRPSGFVATDPNSPGYSWRGLDAIVEATAAAGLTPILDVNYTPKWAYAVPAHGSDAGTPNAADLGQFAAALATHYDGKHGVPAEHVFQVWNEPNNSLDLSPATGVGYRKLVNAFAHGVHGVDPTSIVVAGGLDPFANARFSPHAPLAFMRSMLCLSKGAHPHATCRTRVHFDVWAHHPYTFGGPFGHARLPDDVSLGDLPRMGAVLRAAVKLHHVVSARRVQFWVTEFAWDTNPPRRGALKTRLQARATAESLYQMWRSGISLATWFLLQDEAGPDNPFKSGLYYAGAPIATARAKPTLTAFRFPFVAYRNRRTVSIWGRDATSTKETVTIERRHGASGRWRQVARIEANRYGIFAAKLGLRASAKDSLRATAPDSGDSLAFSLSRPKYPHVGPWGNCPC